MGFCKGTLRVPYHCLIRVILGLQLRVLEKERERDRDREREGQGERDKDRERESELLIVNVVFLFVPLVSSGIVGPWCRLGLGVAGGRVKTERV